jgi:predicted membrane channel-forming protein YqfA (hemolysin III family)
MAFVLGAGAVSLALKWFCGNAWRYRPAQGWLKFLVVAWIILISLTAIMSFLRPGWDVFFCISFFGFLIGAQLRNIYLYRVGENPKPEGPSANC